MQFRQFILAASLVVAPIALIGSTPANAAQSCTCTDIIFPSGACSRYGNCHDLPMLAPGGEVKPIRSLKACPAKKQVLVCDGATCTVTCGPAPQ
jgi:hypothetical protein